jgi:hypothetical protein
MMKSGVAALLKRKTSGAAKPPESKKRYRCCGKI